MTRRITRSLALLFILVTGIAAAAAPEVPTQPCMLKVAASLPMQTEPDGTIAVPIGINGHPKQLVVDTGSIVSSLSLGTVEELGMSLQLGNAKFEFMNGIRVDRFVHVGSIALGSFPDGGDNFLVLPPDMLEEDDAGMLAPDIMQVFDVDFDFIGENLKLFLPNICPTAPIYWTHEPYAEVPMKLDNYEHVVVSASLDGKPVTVVIDTGSSRSTMSVEAARDLFDWARAEPNLKAFEPESINGGVPVPVWRYPFATLTFEGIQVVHPDIDLIPQQNLDRHGRPDAQIILGMSVLRQLHLYVGYQARKLYLTAAEAR